MLGPGPHVGKFPLCKGFLTCESIRIKALAGNFSEIVKLSRNFGGTFTTDPPWSGCVRGLHQPRPPAPGPAVPGGGQGGALREAAGHQPAGDPAAGPARPGQGGVPHGGHLEQVHPSLQGNHQHGTVLKQFD